MSQARRQRREMLKRFGLLGKKDEKSKNIINYLNNISKEIRLNSNSDAEETIESVETVDTVETIDEVYTDTTVCTESDQSTDREEINNK